MINSLIRLSLLVLFSSVSLHAQKCDDLEKWFNSVAREFPGSNHSQVRSGTEQYNIIRFNLLTDSYFVPIFGKPYKSLTEKERKKIDNALINCERKSKAGNFAAKWYMWGIFSQPVATEEAIKVIDRITIQEVTITKDEERFKNETVSLAEIEKIRLNYRNIKGILMPEYYQKRIQNLKDAEAKTHDALLISQSEKLLKDFKAVEDYHNVLNTTNQLRSTYQLSSDKAIAHSKSLFEKKANDIFEREIRQDMATITSEVKIVEETSPEILKAARILNHFKQKYTPYHFDNKAQSFLKKINQLFTVLVDSDANVFAYLIEKSIGNPIHIEHIDYLFLNHVKPTTDNIKKLLDLRESVRPEVRDLRRKMADSTFALRKQDTQLRKDKIAEVNQKIAQLNKETGYKYLSLSALQKIFKEYSDLTVRNDYSRADFLGLLSTFNQYWFVRKQEGNLSLSETFDGPKNQNIYLVKDKSDSKMLTYSIPMTETKIIETYLKEIYAKTKRVISFNKKYNDKHVLKAGETFFFNDEKLTYRVSITADEKIRISIFRLSEPLSYIENLTPYSIRFTPDGLSSSIFLRGNSSLFIKVDDSWLFKDKKGLNLDGYPEIKSGRFVSEYPYGALLYSYNNKDWFYLGGKQQVLYPKVEKSHNFLYLRLNCTDTSEITGFADIEYSVMSFSNDFQRKK